MKHPAIGWRKQVLSDHATELGVPSLTPTERLVAVAFAEHVNSDGEAWPGPAKLAKRTGLSHRSVKRALAALESGGWLHPVSRGGGYDAVTGEPVTTRRAIRTPCHSDTGARVRPGQTVQHPVPQATQPRANVAPELEEQLEDELEARRYEFVDDDPSRAPTVRPRAS